MCRSGTERLEMAPRALRHEERKYHFHERGRCGKGHLLRSALRSPRNRADVTGQRNLYDKVLLQNTRDKIDKLHKAVLVWNVQNKNINP